MGALRLRMRLRTSIANDTPMNTATGSTRDHHPYVYPTLAVVSIAANTAQGSGAFEEVIRATAEKLGVKAGQLIHPSRVALTGQSRSAGIFEVMELMGAPRTVRRLRTAAAS